MQRHGRQPCVGLAALATLHAQNAAPSVGADAVVVHESPHLLQVTMRGGEDEVRSKWLRAAVAVAGPHRLQLGHWVHWHRNRVDRHDREGDPLRAHALVGKRTEAVRHDYGFMSRDHFGFDREPSPIFSDLSQPNALVAVDRVAVQSANSSQSGAIIMRQHRRTVAGSCPSCTGTPEGKRGTRWQNWALNSKD